MQLKETAFGYNLTTKNHSNSDWGAEIGQGKKKLMDVEGISEILNGMLYYKVDNNDDITAILGKGNRSLHPLSYYEPDTTIVVASVIEKVQVNGKELPGIKFIMFVTKDERKYNNKGEPNVQYQRRSLKFPDKAEYKGVPLNKQCFDAITKELDCAPTGSWIVTDMDFVGDSLNLTAMVIDHDNPHDFTSVIDRSETLKRIKYMETKNKLKPSTYFGELSPVILYGPPGTGKTHKMQRDYISKFDIKNRFIVTFHQAFSYEEFVEGLRPVLNEDEDASGDIKYRIVKGVFREACERAAQLAGYSTLKECIEDTFNNRFNNFKQAKNEKKYVLLCIDEINRGNIAAIFGDLISLIEESKRLGVKEDTEMVVSLPYSQDKFGVPANLLIVGTMNTADRSIQLLDTALRRRFRFEELLPDYSLFVDSDPAIAAIKGDARKILENINGRIRCLLNKDSQIGHSYLMFANSHKEIFLAIVNKIIPLLEEYFYDDIAKVRFVLNEDDSTRYPFYKEDDAAKEAFQTYLNESDIDNEEKSFFELNYSIKKDTDYIKYLKHLLGEPEE